MVVIVSREGQLANRMSHTTHFMVNSKAHDYSVAHLFFDDYYKFFSESLGGRNFPVRFFCKNQNWRVKFFQNAVTNMVKVLLNLGIRKLPFFELIKYESFQQDAKPFDLNDPGFIKKARSKIVLVYGWLFRDLKNIDKYKASVIDTWKANNEFLESIDSYYKKYKSGNDILIGVHIRGGDYKSFEGGKWYYTPDQYYGKMKELADLQVFKSKRIGFVICTNEKDVSLQNQENFSVFNDQRHFIEDLYLLAKCDYIIGPPSTFTMWASFYGNVPLHTLTEISSNLTDQRFTPQVASI